MDPANERHPSSMSDEEKAELRKSDPSAFDEEPAAAAGNGDDDKGDAAAAGGDDAGEAGEGQGEDGGAAGGGNESAEADDTAAGEASGADAAGKPAAGEPGKAAIPKARLDEVIRQRNAAESVVKQQQEELAQLRQSIAENKPPKDFDAEFDALDKKYDAGEIDESEYNKQTRALTREEGRYVARAEALRSRQETVQELTNNSWDADVKAWSAQNPGFLEKHAEVFQKALNATAQLYGTDLSNSDMLEKASKMAFELTDYKPPAGSAADAGTKPGASRRVQNAERAAAASAAPAIPTGGVGGRGRESSVDLSHIKPGEFSKLPKAEQEKLLGRGAV